MRYTLKVTVELSDNTFRVGYATEAGNMGPARALQRTIDKHLTMTYGGKTALSVEAEVVEATHVGPRAHAHF